MSEAPSSPAAGAGTGSASVTLSVILARGNGSSSATPKMTSITAIRARLATEMVNIDQCRYWPGPFMWMAEATRLVDDIGNPLLLVTQIVDHGRPLRIGAMVVRSWDLWPYPANQ